MADVFMNWLVDNVSKIGCSPHILCRFVDDIFWAFDSKDEMDKFFQNSNKVHSSIFFSKEVEADGQLTYLDVLLTKNEQGIETTIYRKNTHTGLYKKWENLSPIQYKKVALRRFCFNILCITFGPAFAFSNFDGAGCLGFAFDVFCVTALSLLASRSLMVLNC